MLRRAECRQRSDNDQRSGQSPRRPQERGRDRPGSARVVLHPLNTRFPSGLRREGASRVVQLDPPTPTRVPQIACRGRFHNPRGRLEPAVGEWRSSGAGAWWSADGDLGELLTASDGAQPESRAGLQSPPASRCAPRSAPPAFPVRRRRRVSRRSRAGAPLSRPFSVETMVETMELEPTNPCLQIHPTRMATNGCELLRQVSAQI